MLLKFQDFQNRPSNQPEADNYPLHTLRISSQLTKIQALVIVKETKAILPNQPLPNFIHNSSSSNSKGTHSNISNRNRPNNTIRATRTNNNSIRTSHSTNSNNSSNNQVSLKLVRDPSMVVVILEATTSFLQMISQPRTLNMTISMLTLLKVLNSSVKCFPRN